MSRTGSLQRYPAYTRAIVPRSRGPLPAALVSIAGAGALIASLFLTWSHQIGPAEHRLFHGRVLFGVPPNPDALQVYAIAGEVLGTRQSGEAAFRLASPELSAALIDAAQQDARLLIDRDGGLHGERGAAARLALYLFERDAAVGLLASG